MKPSFLHISSYMHNKLIIARHNKLIIVQLNKLIYDRLIHGL